MSADVDVVVVGGGLAGLTAAAELGRAGLRCIGFCGAAPGGLLLSIESVEGLPEHPDGIPGYDLCPIAQEEAMDAGVSFVSDDATALQRDGSLWRVDGAGKTVLARAVVLAPGSRLRELGVPGEARLRGKGVSHCASCDGPLLRGRPVAVVGGGDAACQEALTLARSAGAVHLLLRGEVLRARPGWVRRVLAEPKIRVHPMSPVAAIDGGEAVQAVTLADGRRIEVDAVFVYAGLVPCTGWLRERVPLDGEGRIVVDEALRCTPAGLFAAGSARRGHSGQAVDARADGVAVARSVQEHLSVTA